MRKWFSRLFTGRSKPETFNEALEDLPASTTTSQKAIDTERPSLFYNDQQLIIPPFDLTKYLDLYLTDSLSKALVDSDTNLVVSPLQCKSDDEQLCEYIDEFHKRIDMLSIVWQLQRDVALFGFGVAEIVGNAKTLKSSSEILGVKRLDPRFIIIQKDQRGHYRFFRQRPSFLQSLSAVAPATNTGYPFTLDIPLDPQSIIFVQNWSPLTSYGHSLLQSIKKRLVQRNEIIDAAVEAAKNHANPVNHLHFAFPPELKEITSEAEAVKRSIRTQLKNIDKGKTRWLVSAGQGDYTLNTIGNSNLPDITQLYDRITQEIIIAAGHSPVSLGFHLGKNSARENENSGKQTINTIITKQRNLVAQLQAKLYTILPFIEQAIPSGEITVEMEEPTEETLKAKLEAQAIELNNVILMGKAGIVSGENAARKLGFDDLDDSEKWNKLTEPVMDRVNENDPNQNQAVKSAIASTNKGNNPSGGQ